MPFMFSHDEVWLAIDSLAMQNDMSVSRLARNAGLDPTTFNKSKRKSPDGRLRWPSTESLSKIMVATGTDIDDFAALVAQVGGGYGISVGRLEQQGFAESSDFDKAASCQIPLLGLAQAGSGGFFDETGLPYGPEQTSWTYVSDNPEDFYSKNISGSQRLLNGNTLICDGPAGYFFEVTPDSEIVWEYNHGSQVFRVDRYCFDPETVNKR